MAEINGDEKRITVSGEQIEEVVSKMPTVEADVKTNKQSISALQADVSKHTEDIAKNTADISSVNTTLENKANADEVYSKDETDSAITAKVAEIVAGAPEEFDTLKEMSDWLTEHSGSAAEMNSAIQANTSDIEKNETNISKLKEDTFGTPEARITSNSDLDTFTATGAYICLSSAVAKTLINCPVSIGFRMDVKALGAGVERYAQTIYPNEIGNVYCYFRRLTSEGWTAWDKVVGGEVYGLGIQIKSNSDLNDPAYFVPGVYRAPSNDVAGSLLNCPIKRGFRMEVKESIYAGVGMRFIYPNAISSEFGTFYMQNVTTSNGAQHLGNWFKFRGEEILPTTTTTE